MVGTNRRRLTYTKKDLVKLVVKATNSKIPECTKWVDQVLKALREVIMSANPELRIELRDFGVFEVKLTKPKPQARNPRSGEIIYVPSHRKTHFKPSKLLKKFLSQPMDQKLNIDRPNKSLNQK
ncbi:MAG TPA: HU family DNA-binding protein [Bacteroidota bacterium]|nr:HU family DNA-binding protein [Bacteroidota bacterium]